MSTMVLKIAVLMSFLLAALISGYFFGQTQILKNLQNKRAADNGSTASPSPEIANQPSTPTEPAEPTAEKSKIDLESLRPEFQKISGIDIEAFDVKSDGSSAVFLGHDEKWSKYGVYLYDLKTKKVKTLFELNESIFGRGGYYLDNVDLKFSPDGQNLFANKTGTNFPAFLVFKESGEILLQGQNLLGHATWIAVDRLLYLKTADEPAQLFNTVSQKSETTNLPSGLFHLKANEIGTILVAFRQAQSQLKCESFDLLLYRYPSANLVKTIPNTSLTAKWTTNNSLNYEKVTGCKKNDENAMTEYSPLTSKETEILNSP